MYDFSSKYIQNNVLISKSGVAQIADFGQSRIIDHDAYITFAQHKHNAIYLAPEIIYYLSKDGDDDLSEDNTDDTDSLKLNTKKADVYAFSITAAEVGFFVNIIQDFFNHCRF